MNINYNSFGWRSAHTETQLENVNGSPPTHSAKSPKSSWRFLFTLFFALFLAQIVVGQASLISATGDGGFENGATFAANGWTVSNSTNNPWFVGAQGAVSATGNRAYVSSNAGVGSVYDLTTQCINYFYRDITVAAGQTKIVLTFNSSSVGENNYDVWQVFTCPTSTVPTAVAAFPNFGATAVPAALTGGVNIAGANAVVGVQTQTILLPASLAGTTFRLVFSWKSDTSFGTQPPASIDNISLISDVPGNYTSIVTGNYSALTTWNALSAPTILDNVTIAAGHTVTIDAANQIAKNLTVDGTGILTFGTVPTAFTVAGNLTVSSGGTFNAFNGTAGKSVLVAGNLTNDGVIDLSKGIVTANVLTLNGTTVQTVGGSGSFVTSVIRNLIFNNTNAAVPNIIWNFNNLSIGGNLNFTAGKVALGANKLTLGTGVIAGTGAGSVGSLSYTAGGFTGGTFNRYWTAGGTGGTINAGSDPTSALGRYPFISGLNQQRSAFIERSTALAAGQLSCTYANATTSSAVLVVDGTYTIEGRYNGNWTFSTEGSAYAATNNEVALLGTGAYIALNANTRILNAAAAAGTQQGGTITPGGQRLMSVAQLTGGALYLGAANADIAQPCAGTPVAGTIPANSPACLGVAQSAITVTGFSTGITGTSFQWQESFDNVTFANVTTGTGGTTASYTPTAQTVIKYYQCVVACSNSGLSALTNVTTAAIVNCDYNVARSAGITYSSIETTGIGLTGFTSIDDSSSSATNIGFNFFYKGTNYSQFVANTNGFMALGASSLSGFSNNLSTETNIIAPFWDDLYVTGLTAGQGSLVGTYIKYKLDGVAPNRVLTVEWIGMERYQYAGPNLNFQAKLYETSNRIEFLYGSMESQNGTTTSFNVSEYTYSVGISGPSGTGTFKTLALLGENSTAFGAIDPTTLAVDIECSSKYTFDTALVYSGVSTFTYSAPANDDAVNATAIGVNALPCTNLCGTYYTTGSATPSAQTSSCTTAPDDDVWFKFVAPTASKVIVTVRGATGFDAVVGLTDASFVELAGLGCVNATLGASNFGQTETLLATGLTPGATYYVRVSHNGSGFGSRSGFSICVSEVPAAPSNDNPCGAVVLATTVTCTPYADNTALTGTTASTTSVISATTTTSNGVVSPTQTGAVANVSDVWFKFTAATDFQGVLVTPVAGFDVAFQAFTANSGTTCPTTLALTPLFTANLASTGAAENVQMPTVSGTEYYLRVFRHPSGISGAPVNNSQFSICIFNPTPVCVINAAPANLATAVSVTPTLTWPAASYASSYDVFIRTSSGTSTLLANVLRSAASPTSYTLTSAQALDELTQYFWYVTPKNATGSAPCGVANETSFTTNSVPLVVTSFVPASICSVSSNAQRTVTITGSGFTPSSTVTVNGVAAQSTTYNNPTEIVIIVASGSTAGLANVVVTKASGSGANTTGLTVNASPAPPVIAGGTEVCIGNALTLTNGLAGGTWLSSDISVATITPTGVVTAITAGVITISYTVVNGNCSAAVTQLLTVNAPVIITSSTPVQTITTGDSTSFVIVASGAVSYQWQVDTNDLTGFNNIAGATSATLALTSVPTTFDGYTYQCIITGNGSCASTTSSPATLNVGNIGITTNPTNVDLCSNGAGTASFSVVTSGELPTYQWQEDQGGSNWLNIINGGNYAGVTSATLSLTGLTTANSGYNYRCIVTGNVLSITSNAAILTVNQSATIVTNPANTAVCYSGGSTSFTAVAAGAFTAYQWEYSADNVTFATVANGTPLGTTYIGVSTGTLSVTTTAATPGSGTYYFRATALASAPCTNVSSASAQLNIDTPVLTAQPVATSVIIGNSTSFAVITSAAVPSYQWQRATTVNGSYSNVVNGTPVGLTYSGMMSATLNVASSVGVVLGGGNFYRCVVSNNVTCSVNSAGALLTLTNYCQPSTTSPGAPDTITNTVITNTTTSLNITQASTGSVAYTLYNNIPLSIGQLQNVSAALTFGSDPNQHSAIWVDYNQNGVFEATENVALSTSVAPGSSTITYNFVVPLTALPGLTRLRVRGGSDNPGYTAAGACLTTAFGDTEDYFVNITVAPPCAGTPSVAVVASSVPTICISGTANLTATNFSTGALGISYQWFNTAGAITGATSANYTTPILTAPESYYFVVTCAASGLSSTSNTVSIGIDNPTITGTTPASRCGVGSIALAATGSTGTNLNWYAAANGGSPLATGGSFTIPLIAATTTYYVGASNGGSSASGGKPSTNGADATNTTGGINFTANTAFNLNSVVMYPRGAGTNTIVLYAGTAISGVPLFTSTATFTGASSTGVTVPLNWAIPAGSYTIYQSAGNVNCYRDLSGGISVPTTSYPYNIGLACTLTNGTIGGYYYYFYNWSITSGCNSARTAVVATVTPAPALAISAAAVTICSGNATPTVTITTGTADYDTFTWSPSTGVSGNSTAGYTFNPTASTTYTLIASQSAGLCANAVTYGVTVNVLPTVFALTSATNAVCTTDAPLLITAKPSNSAPISGCLNGLFGEFPVGGLSTATTCDGSTPTVISNFSYGGEFSTVATSANFKYVFTSSIATDYITITDVAKTTVIAAGPTPLTWYSGSTPVNVLQWIFSDASCGQQQSARTKAYICGPIQGAVFTPNTGLFTNAAGTIPYAGTAVTQVYAKPAATTAYVATTTNAAGCVRTATKTITVTTAITWTLDADNDGYGAIGGATQLACVQPVGYAALTGDCNDTNANINPGKAEVLYNGIDDNCDGNLDEGFQLKTKVQVAQCGSTLPLLTSTIYAQDVSYSSYRFRVTNTTTNAVQTIVNVNHWFRLTSLPVYDYGQSYSVEIEIQRAGVWLGYYGAPCIVSTPAAVAVPGVASLNAASCGATMTVYGQTLSATLTTGVTGFQFRISGGTQPTEIITRTQQWFTLAMFPTVRTYGATYTVEVAVKTTGAYSAFGPTCSVTLPSAKPLTATSCGAVLASRTNAINTTVLAAVTKYRFQVTDPSNQVQVVDRVPAYFNLSQLPSGYTANTVYSVKVAVETGNSGVYSAYSTACNITTPATLTAKGLDVAVSDVSADVQDFKVIALPNPFTTTFGFDIQSFTDGQVAFKVYDMIGKLLESREVKFEDVINQSLGENYPAGVYSIIVSQGDNNQTLRVVKR